MATPAPPVAKGVAVAGRALRFGPGVKTEVVTRAMSRAELDDTRATRLVRGGRGGEHYATNDRLSRSADAIQDRLALPVRPEVKVKLEVPKGRFGSSRTVTPQ